MVTKYQFLILHISNNHCLILRNVQEIKFEAKKGKELFALNTSQDVIILGGKIKIDFVYIVAFLVKNFNK